MKIGVLDIQGSVEEHMQHLQQLPDVEPIRAKTVNDIASIDGLVIPGGESTAIAKMLHAFNLHDLLKERIQRGMPVYGTCAGMILLANSIEGEQSHLGVMDIQVKRNAYGSQMDSFVIEQPLPPICDRPLPLVFIRAPYIVSHGDSVQVLTIVEQKTVAARQDNMLVTSFHPELTEHTEVHGYFCQMVRESMNLH